MSSDGRSELPCCLENNPNVICVRDEGSEETDWLDNPIASYVICVSEEGGEATGLLKSLPKVRCVSDEGSEVIGWLNELSNVM